MRDAIKDGVQTIQYQLLTLLTTNGQTPFVTIFMYLNEVKDEKLKEDYALVIEEVIRQRYKGVKNEEGVYITPAFPKLIYVLEEDNIKPESKYFYLTKLALKCTAKRLVPDYISEKVMKEIKDGYVYSSMGCRSFLAPWYDQNGSVKFWGRGNMGVVTVNLPHVAMSSDKDYDRFWKLFDERLELCHEALLCRYKRLKGTKSDVAPIMWQHGAIARLEKGETIDKLLVGGYTSISLGYAGLYECVKFMTGKSHTDPSATPFAIEIMNYMNSKVAEWTKQDNLGYSIYGTPIESTTYKFAKSLQSQFGIVEGVSDKNYITNSYHVNVREEIDAYSKLGFEAQFQKLSSGGSISYVEIPNMQDNPEALESLAEFLYDHNLYAEFNSKSDFCHICGFDGEIQIVTDEETGKLVWECPICKNRDQDKMNVARRTCGYIGSQFWNQGRTEEIKDRVLHL